MHQRRRIARDAYRRRSARFDADDERLVRYESAQFLVERGQAAPQRVGNRAGHPLFHSRRGDARHVGAARQRSGRFSGYEVGQPLRRGDLPVADLPVGQLFELLLETQPGQFPVFGPQVFEVGKADFGDDARIGEYRVAARRRHAVDDRLSGARHGRHDKTSRTHAERVDAPSADLADQRVRGGGQVFAAFGQVVLRAVDQLLRMFGPDAHRERFGFDPYSPAVQDFVDVARRVSGRENYGGPFDRRVAEADPGDFSVPDSDVGYFRPEQHLSAGVDDRLSHRGDDARQSVGADVRVRVVQDRLVGAVEAENFERLAVVAAFFRAREELAVGIGARSAFAESVVRFRIYRAVAVDPGDVPLRAETSRPRSSTIGRKPRSISRSAANSPAGPDPTTTTGVRPPTCG